MLLCHCFCFCCLDMTYKDGWGNWGRRGCFAMLCFVVVLVCDFCFCCCGNVWCLCLFDVVFGNDVSILSFCLVGGNVKLVFVVLLWQWRMFFVFCFLFFAIESMRSKIGSSKW